MEIKNLNLFLENFKKGAKKVVKVVPAVVIASALTFSPLAANAAVPNDEILGDAQVQEDRTNIKIQDGFDINDYFDGYDEYGCMTVSMEDIKKAIEMSDALNASWDYSFNDINTTKNEVLGLNIYDLYGQYQSDPNWFAYHHQQDRSAMDAYLTLSSHTVTTHVKDEIANLIASYVVGHGQNLTAYPRVTITDGEVFCIVGINGCVEKIVLHGEKIDEIQRECVALDRHYSLALNSINGSSNKYEDTFAYNGVRSTTGESVWLSMSNDELKNQLRNGIASVEELENGQQFEFSTADPYAYYYMAAEEAIALQEEGYYIPDVNSVIVRDVYLNRNYNYGK